MWLLWCTAAFLPYYVTGRKFWWNYPLQLRSGDRGDDTRGPLSQQSSRWRMQYILTEETTVYQSRWRSLIQRRVIFPIMSGGNNKTSTHDFLVVRQGGTDRAVLVFAWDSKTQTATFIREYMPSSHRTQVGLAAGMIETDKHQVVPRPEQTVDTVHQNTGGSTSAAAFVDCDSDEDHDDGSLTAAQYELEEECRLVGGRRWIRLARDVVMDKYSTTRLSVYLVLDAIPIDAAQAKPRDETEVGMEILQNITLAQIFEWIEHGELTVVGTWATLLALDKLRRMGEIE